MAKGKAKAKTTSSASTAAPKGTIPATNTLIRTIADLKNDETLWYRTRLLIDDFLNMAKDITCANRLGEATDPNRIGHPYFFDEEATIVKGVVMEDGTTLLRTIELRMEMLERKREASDDKRPCGPHDMAPIWLDIFGLAKQKLEDEKFVSRVRRQGLSR